MAELFTQKAELDHPSEGYIIIAPLSTSSKRRIAEIQGQFIKRLGKANLWIPSEDQLHITFAHIITPNVEYPEDRATLFSRVRPFASAALRQTVRSSFIIKSKFNTVEASLSNVILKATDDGSFEQLRKTFIDNFTPPEGSRVPPNIIHTTLLRFRESIDFNAVQALTQEIMAEFEPFEEQTTRLQMIREKKIYVQDHEVLEEFPLPELDTNQSIPNQSMS